ALLGAASIRHARWFRRLGTSECDRENSHPSGRASKRVDAGRGTRPLGWTAVARSTPHSPPFWFGAGVAPFVAPTLQRPFALTRQRYTRAGACPFERTHPVVAHEQQCPTLHVEQFFAHSASPLARCNPGFTVAARLQQR